MNIYEALERAADLRIQADVLRREADKLEREWVGVTSDGVITIKTLVDVIRKIGQSE
jgi:hypothetical protein